MPNRLILPPGVKSSLSPDINEWPTYESYECEGMQTAVDIVDKHIKDKEEAGESTVELQEERDGLIEACNNECGSTIGGCAVDRIIELTSARLQPPSSVALDIATEVASIIAINAQENDGLFGVLTERDIYLQGVVNAHLEPIQQAMTEHGLEIVTLTDGAWQQLAEEFRGNLRVAIQAVKDLTRVMAEIQRKGLLLGHTAEIAEMLENPPKTIYKADIENLFNNKDFARWVELACTPKGEIFRSQED